MSTRQKCREQGCTRNFARKNLMIQRVILNLDAPTSCFAPPISPNSNPCTYISHRNFNYRFGVAINHCALERRSGHKSKILYVAALKLDMLHFSESYSIMQNHLAKLSERDYRRRRIWSEVDAAGLNLDLEANARAIN